MPFAHLAGHINIRQKVHFYLDDAIALACLAATALDIKGEAPRRKAAHFRIGGGSIQLPNIGKDTGIGRRIGARRAPDRRLVNVDHLVQMFDAFDGAVLAGTGTRVVQIRRQSLVQNLVDQRGFTGTRHTGDAIERPQLKGDIDVF